MFRAVRLPEGLERIGDQAFSGMYRLGVISFPGSLKSIGARAFRACTGLTRVSLPEGLESIGDFAFLHGAKEVRLPESLRYLVRQALGDRMYTPTILQLPSRAPYLAGNAGSDLITQAQTAQELYPYEGHPIVSGDFAYTVDELGEATIIDYLGAGGGSMVQFPAEIDGHPVVALKAIHAEQASRGEVREIRLPEGLRRLGHYALSFFWYLEKLNIPMSLEKVDDYGLGTASWIELSPEHPVYTLVEGAVYDKRTRTLVQYHGGASVFVVPKGIEHIAGGAFGDSKPREVVLPEGLLTIGDGAFSMMPRLAKINLPDSLISIANNSFSGSWELEDILYNPGSYGQHWYMDLDTMPARVD